MLCYDVIEVFDMFITRIEVQKKNPKRFNIFVNKGHGEEFGFSVHEDTLVQFGLRKGLELDEFEVIEIQYGDEARKAYNKAIEYLGYKMRTKKEVYDYLRKKNVGEQIILEVIQLLIEQKYIDDEEYAKAYVRTQMNTSKKGPVLIEKELSEKGIPETLIEEALTQFSSEHQIDVAYSIAEKYETKSDNISFQQRQQKIEQALIRKGFSFNIIHIVLDMLPKEENDNKEWNALCIQAEKAKKRYAKFDSYTATQKLKQFLYRKGFSIDLIDRYIHENEDM